MTFKMFQIRFYYIILESFDNFNIIILCNTISTNITTYEYLFVFGQYIVLSADLTYDKILLLRLVTVTTVSIHNHLYKPKPSTKYTLLNCCSENIDR